MKPLYKKFLFSTLLLFYLISFPAAENHQTETQKEWQGKMILGREERVLFPSIGVSYTARIDTGAELSSLHAMNVIPFTKNGEQWVQFNLEDDGETRVYDCPLESMIAVRQANNPKAVYRPLVKLNIQIGTLNKDALFTLADRSRMSFPVLIGRNILTGDVLVDASAVFLQGQ